ncbi:hypothetical protein AYI68_g2972 [Smittium mucronatum]|uniref:Uncharacterized protein n=1 Tax=Smittium mucronatum TaxID=133383 RepID=A0A1R0H195_9FUNG|nr:hypothetical protein AYI68_g2972 [Smittium mucronatum]
MKQPHTHTRLFRFPFGQSPSTFQLPFSPLPLPFPQLQIGCPVTNWGDGVGKRPTSTPTITPHEETQLEKKHPVP